MAPLKPWARGWGHDPGGVVLVLDLTCNFIYLQRGSGSKAASSPAENYLLARRRTLQVVVSALLTECGFESAEKAAVETLTEMMQSCMYEPLSHLCGRLCISFNDSTLVAHKMLCSQRMRKLYEETNLYLFSPVLLLKLLLKLVGVLKLTVNTRREAPQRCQIR